MTREKTGSAAKECWLLDESDDGISHDIVRNTNLMCIFGCLFLFTQNVNDKALNLPQTIGSGSRVRDTSFAHGKDFSPSETNTKFFNFREEVQ